MLGRLNNPVDRLLRSLDRGLSRTMFVFIIAGVVLSTLHQSSLGTLTIIAGPKMHPLWQTPILPLLFLLSAIAVGLPMVIVESLAVAGKFKPRVYRSASFGPDGSVYLGEHMLAKDPPPGIEKLTTIKFPRLPDTGWLGHCRIYKYDRDWNLLRQFDVDHAKELTGFKGVTHSTLHPSQRFITYTAETSKRIMRFDIVAEKQMPDLVQYPGDNPRDGNWAIALRYLPDGRLLVTRGKTMDLLDEQGQVLRTYDLGEGYGWAETALCRDGRHVLLANIWTGIAAKMELDSGRWK